MKKQQAIHKIQELQAKVAELKAIVNDPEPNKITQWPTAENLMFFIEDRWAGEFTESASEGIDKPYHKETGRTASLYLCNGQGQWYNEQGQQVKGYLYFEPAK